MAAAPAGWTDEDFFDLHWLLKRLGQTLCMDSRTRCGACPAAALCEERRRTTARGAADNVLALQRSLAAGSGRPVVSPREVLEYATIEGARANGLDHKTGTLTPGKEADLILLRTDRLNVTPLNDPATAVVVGMDTSNVDTVLIAGRVMKRVGRLLHVDWRAVREAALEARDHVIERSGYKLPKI